jgi:hypothetical protein
MSRASSFVNPARAKLDERSALKARMSALGQKLTFRHQIAMSPLHSKADSHRSDGKSAKGH